MLLALLLIVGCMSLHVRMRPYDADVLDGLEMRTLFAAGATLLLGIAVSLVTDGSQADAAGAAAAAASAGGMALSEQSRAQWADALVFAILAVNAYTLWCIASTLLRVAVTIVVPARTRARLAACGRALRAALLCRCDDTVLFRLRPLKPPADAARRLLRLQRLAARCAQAAADAAPLAALVQHSRAAALRAGW